MSFTSSTGGTTEFVYDPTAGIPAVLKETGSAYDKNYVREPDGSLIAMFVGSYPYYYHFDALGSTRMLTDETGHITDTYTYDAWGNASHTSGTTNQPYQYVGQLGYYAHYQDANLPLLQLGVRFYDPQVGRFTQPDPADEDSNRYAYAEDNPAAAADPFGMGALPWPCNSQICNDTKDQCVITWSGGPESVLGPGKCTSSLWDRGDFGYFRGRWRKCGGKPWACHAKDGKQTGFGPPIGPPHVPSKGTCQEYCKCQMKSKHKRDPREADFSKCMKSCLHPKP